MLSLSYPSLQLIILFLQLCPLILVIVVVPFGLWSFLLFIVSLLFLQTFTSLSLSKYAFLLLLLLLLLTFGVMLFVSWDGLFCKMRWCLVVLLLFFGIELVFRRLSIAYILFHILLMLLMLLVLLLLTSSHLPIIIIIISLSLCLFLFKFILSNDILVSVSLNPRQFTLLTRQRLCWEVSVLESGLGSDSLFWV